MKLYQIVGGEHENTKGQKRKNKLNGWHRHRLGKRLKLEPLDKEKVCLSTNEAFFLSKVLSACKRALTTQKVCVRGQDTSPGGEKTWLENRTPSRLEVSFW